MRASRSLGTFGGVRGIAAVLAALVSLQACSQRASAEASQNRMTAVQEKMERVRHLAPEWVQSGGEAHLIQARMQEVHQLLESGKIAEAEARLDDALALLRAPVRDSGKEPRTVNVPPPEKGQGATVPVGLPLSPFQGMKRPEQALDLMREAGSRMFGARVAWRELEPQPGRIDFGVAPFPALALVERKYPELLETLVVSVRVVTTTVRTMPGDLEKLDFDDRRVLERIDGVIDALASHELAGKIDYILLGQESDVYLARHPGDVKAFTSFLRHAAERIRAKLPNAKVATTITFGGMQTQADVTGPLIDASDLAVVTYYPLGQGTTPEGRGWVMRPVSEVSSDLSWLAKQIGNKPFAFLEVGYSSHPMNLGSEEKLAEFVRTVFDTLDPYRRNGRLRFMQYWMLYDYPPELAKQLAKELGTEERGSIEYMTTLGLREYEHGGRERAGWKVYVERANQWTQGR